MTDAYEAVVYDLDGTLVRLAVDWDATRRDVAEQLRDAGVAVEGDSLWDLLERGQAEGHGDLVEGVITEHERTGARAAERLPTADELPRRVPVGVCSLNAESACRIALAEHGLAESVEIVVGRDTVSTHKPDPEPLRAAIDALGATPGETLFVGDTERDALTADRAGAQFRSVEETE